MTVRIALGEGELAFVAAHEPCDSLYRLAKALTLALYGIERVVDFYTAEGRIVLRLAPNVSAGRLWMKIDAGASGFVGADLDLRATCQVFLEALCDLSDRLPPEQFELQWQRRFPLEAVQRLTGMLGAGPAQREGDKQFVAK